MTGQARVASFVYKLLGAAPWCAAMSTSTLDPPDGPPQDPYSLRAAPVVMGAVLDTLDYMRDVLTREINARRITR